MGKSGNPAKKAEELKISQIGDFKKRLGGLIELPSGAVVKYKNPGGLQAFITSKSIPNSLMGIVEKALGKGKGIKIDDIISEDKIDPELLADIMILTDTVMLRSVIEPPVHPVPESETDRDDDLLYVDEFPAEDKQFMFQLITGGTKDLETFRQQLNSGMDSLAAVTVAESAAKSDDGTNAG